MVELVEAYTNSLTRTAQADLNNNTSDRVTAIAILRAAAILGYAIVIAAGVGKEKSE